MLQTCTAIQNTDGAGTVGSHRELPGEGGRHCHGQFVPSPVADLVRVGIGIQEPHAPRCLWGHLGGDHGAPDAPRCSSGVHRRLRASELLT